MKNYLINNTKMDIIGLIKYHKFYLDLKEK